jgi:hypothetical protein
MPTPTYVAIAKTVLSSNQAEITFSSIPSTYTDLVVLVSARSASGGSTSDNVALRLNGSTTTYSYTFLSGNGSAEEALLLMNNLLEICLARLVHLTLFPILKYMSQVTQVQLIKYNLLRAHKKITRQRLLFVILPDYGLIPPP